MSSSLNMLKNMNVIKITELILVLVLLTKVCLAADPSLSNDQVKKDRTLVDSLLTGYNKNQRPTDSIIGYFVLKIKRLVSLDEKNQVMTSHGNLNIYWYDPRLAWTPSSFNNIDNVYIPVKSIWFPDVFIANAASSNVWFTINDLQMVHIYYTGIVFLDIPLRALATRCDINIRKYPFDTQKCSITVGSFSQNMERFYYQLNATSIDNSTFFKNPLWEMISYSVKTNSTNDRSAVYFDKVPNLDLFFEFAFKRRPIYFMVNGIFPSLVLNFVTLLSFALPYLSQIGLCRLLH